MSSHDVCILCMINIQFLCIIYVFILFLFMIKVITDFSVDLEYRFSQMIRPIWLKFVKDNKTMLATLFHVVEHISCILVQNVETKI